MLHKMLLRLIETKQLPKSTKPRKPKKEGFYDSLIRKQLDAQKGTVRDEDKKLGITTGPIRDI